MDRKARFDVEYFVPGSEFVADAAATFVSAICTSAFGFSLRNPGSGTAASQWAGRLSDGGRCKLSSQLQTRGIFGHLQPYPAITGSKSDQGSDEKGICRIGKHTHFGTVGFAASARLHSP